MRAFKLISAALFLGVLAMTMPSVASAQGNPVIDNLVNQLQAAPAPVAPGQASPAPASAGGQVKVFDSVPETRDIVDALVPSENTKDLTVIPRHQQRVGLFAITFDYNSTELTPSAREYLDRLGAALRDPKLAGYRFTFEGNTDAAGSYEYNDDLSLRRAQSAAAYIYNRFGVDGRVLLVKGNGKRNLFDPARPYDRVNRNVQIAVLGRL